MIQDIRKEADNKVSVKGREKNFSYPMHTNDKEERIRLILEKDAGRRGQLLFELQAEMEEYILPQRKLYGKERQRNISNKYKNNQKSSFKKVHAIPMGKGWTFFFQHNLIVVKTRNIRIAFS